MPKNNSQYLMWGRRILFERKFTRRWELDQTLGLGRINETENSLILDFFRHSERQDHRQEGGKAHE